MIQSKKKDRKIGSNQFWDIIVDGEKAGEIQSLLSWKNVKDLKEKMSLTIGEETYHYSSFVVGSQTKIVDQYGNTIATGKRVKWWTYALEFSPGIDESERDELKEIVLYMGFMLFSYFHRQ
jgi:hypothetical protein